MSELLKRYYVKEEEFLDEFQMVATVAAWFMQGAWSPEYSCDDGVRRERERLRLTGALDRLVFAGAAVYHDASGFSSVQIVLQSATRTVNLRVKKTGQELVAQKISDRVVSGSVGSA